MIQIIFEKTFLENHGFNHEEVGGHHLAVTSVICHFCVLTLYSPVSKTGTGLQNGERKEGDIIQFP